MCATIFNVQWVPPNVMLLVTVIFTEFVSR